jgi:ribosome-associated protein
MRRPIWIVICRFAGVREIQIRGATIRLGQLIKLAGIVGSGSEVKMLLAAEPAIVNGAPETRRGRQLTDGDVIAVGGERLRIRAEQAGAGEGS